MEIKKVIGNKKKDLKIVYVPKNSDIQIGDYVKIIKIEEEEKKSSDNIY